MLFHLEAVKEGFHVGITSSSCDRVFSCVEQVHKGGNFLAEILRIVLGAGVRPRPADASLVNTPGSTRTPPGAMAFGIASTNCPSFGARRLDLPDKPCELQYGKRLAHHR